MQYWGDMTMNKVGNIKRGLFSLSAPSLLLISRLQWLGSDGIKVQARQHITGNFFSWTMSSMLYKIIHGFSIPNYL